MNLKKLFIVLSLALISSNANAQSAKEVFSVISTFPTEKEILAQLNSDRPFESLLKNLNEKIDKYDNAINSTEEAVSEKSIGLFLQQNLNVGEMTEEKAAEMENQYELMAKIGEYNLELIQTFKPIMMDCENELSELNNRSDDEDPTYKALYEKLSSIKQDKTDYNNHVATLAAINKFNREYHAVYSQIATRKISQNLDILKKAYDKLKPHQNKLVQMDEDMVKNNKNMKNGMENINDVREMLIEFVKMYKEAIVNNVPSPLKQYKTWKEYEEEDKN